MQPGVVTEDKAWHSSAVAHREQATRDMPWLGEAGDKVLCVNGIFEEAIAAEYLKPARVIGDGGRAKQHAARCRLMWFRVRRGRSRRTSGDYRQTQRQH